MPKAVGGWKVCSECGERKSISEFSKFERNLGGHKHWCKACVQAYSKAHYAANRDKILAQHKVYDATEAGKAAHRAGQQRHSQTEKGKVTSRVASARYYRTEGGKATQKRRRARKAGCVGSHTYEEFVALCGRGDFQCLRCGQVFPFEELTEDHIISIGPGVSDRIDNIQPLCGPCNSKKGRRTIDYRPKEVLEWLRCREVRASGHSELPGAMRRDSPKAPNGAQRRLQCQCLMVKS